jgi:hypothetical protein
VVSVVCYNAAYQESGSMMKTRTVFAAVEGWKLDQASRSIGRMMEGELRRGLGREARHDGATWRRISKFNCSGEVQRCGHRKMSHQSMDKAMQLDQFLVSAASGVLFLLLTSKGNCCRGQSLMRSLGTARFLPCRQEIFSWSTIYRSTKDFFGRRV